MIRVCLSISKSGEAIFEFEPEARYWVLNGMSLFQIQNTIIDAVQDHMGKPPEPDRVESIRVRAQAVIDDLITRGLIRL